MSTLNNTQAKRGLSSSITFISLYSLGKNGQFLTRFMKKKREKEELQSILSNRFLQYCEDLEKKGVEIIGNDVKIYTGSKEAEAKGTLTVIMPVGTKQPSQPIEITAPADENEQAGE